MGELTISFQSSGMICVVLNEYGFQIWMVAANTLNKQ